MKAWKQPFEYYLRYDETPVKQLPHDPLTKKIAGQTILSLKKLIGQNTEVLHMGSSALEIAGKNDIEIYIYSKDWEGDKKILARKYGWPGYSEDEFIRFNDTVGNFELEIIMVRGYVGDLIKSVHKYFLGHPEARRSYEKIKQKYSHSKREYQRHKDKFFEKIVENLPKDFLNG